MTSDDLKNYGGNITPMEMYDALWGASAYFTNTGTHDIPKIMQTLNCLRQVVKDDFNIDEQLKDRYKNYGVN